MLERFVHILIGEGLDLSAEDIADSLWLARHVRASSTGFKAEPTGSQFPPPVRESRSADGAALPSPLNLTPAVLSESIRLERESVRSDRSLAELYVQPEADSAASRRNEQPFATPNAPALPGRLSLGRALRPLLKRFASRVTVEFDEVATVEEIADSQIWAPVLRPGNERWLDIDIVVEGAISLHIWYRAIRAFAQLLGRHGAFRRVNLWTLDDEELVGPKVHRGLGQHGRSQPLESLHDVEGRRLVLIVSDGVSAMWRRKSFVVVLRHLAQRQMVSVLQVLPEQLWDRTQLGSHLAVVVRSLLPGSPNVSLHYEVSPTWQIVLGEMLTDAVCLPVVTLEAETLAPWASMVSGDSSARVLAYLVIHENDEITKLEAPPDSNAGRARTFILTASPQARQLAALFTAAAPLTIRVMNLIQRAMLPESRQVHLAEVLLSGLLTPLPYDIGHPEDAPYVFTPDARDRLRNLATVPERITTLELVGAYIGTRLGLGSDFRAWLRSADLTVDDGRLAFARLFIRELTSLPGVDADLATEVAHRLARRNDSQEQSDDINGIGIGNTAVFEKSILLVSQLIVSIRKVQDDHYIADFQLELPDNEKLAAHNLEIILDLAALRVLRLDPGAYARALEAMLFASHAASSLWQRAIQTTASITDTGIPILQIWLDFDPGDTAIHSVRWEELRVYWMDDEAQERVVIIRRAHTTGAPSLSPPLRSELRALTLIATPRDRPSVTQIDISHEVALIGAALGEVPATLLGDHIHATNTATLQSLLDAFQTGAHLLLMRCVAAGRGSEINLLLEDERGGSVAVAAGNFAMAIDSLTHPPRLIVILCERFGDEDITEAIIALLRRLAERGLTGVIGVLPGSLSRSNMHRFTAVLLEELAQHGRIDLALARARFVVAADERRLIIAYSAASDLRLWRREE
jgi:hypothetical protein